MDILYIGFLVGRILFGGYFAMNGMNHFMKSDMLVGYAKSKGVGSAKMAVSFTGILLLLGGLGILFGMYIEWAVLLLTIFLLGVTFRMHRFWNESDPEKRMQEMIHFMTNMALMGAGFMMLMISQPWPYSFG